MYEQIIIVGSGKFAFQCAMRVKRAHSSVFVFEYKASGLSVLESLCKKNDINYGLFEKKQMRQELIKRSDKKTLIISAFNTYLFPEDVVSEENFTIVNYHNAYLPLHRGRNAEAWAIYEDDEFSGVTWHLVDEGVDTGKIIIQEKIDITENMTALMLLQKQNGVAYKLFDGMIDDWLNGCFSVNKKNEFDEISKMHFSWDVPNKGELDLNWDARKISCFLRAMDYGILSILGVSKVVWSDNCYKIKSYKIEESTEPDTIFVNEKSLLIVKDGKKIELQLSDVMEMDSK